MPTTAGLTVCPKCRKKLQEPPTITWQAAADRDDDPPRRKKSSSGSGVMVAWMALNVLTLLVGFAGFPSTEDASRLQRDHFDHGVYRTVNEAFSELLVVDIGLVVVFYICGLCVVAVIKFLLPNKR